jgi:hypothetical protein
MSSNSQAQVHGNVIGMNPTGSLNISNTNSFQTNGSNSIVLNPSNASKGSLNQVQNNKVNCIGIENYENYKSLEKDNLTKKKKLLILIILILFLFLIYPFFFKKKS